MKFDVFAHDIPDLVLCSFVFEQENNLSFLDCQEMMIVCVCDAAMFRSVKILTFCAVTSYCCTWITNDGFCDLLSCVTLALLFDSKVMPCERVCGRNGGFCVNGREERQLKAPWPLLLTSLRMYM